MNDPNQMYERVTDGLVTSPEVVAVVASPEDISTVRSDAQSTICYATDAEVDAAMEKVFEQHDRLLAELAK